VRYCQLLKFSKFDIAIDFWFSTVLVKQHILYYCKPLKFLTYFVVINFLFLCVFENNVYFSEVFYNSDYVKVVNNFSSYYHFTEFLTPHQVNTRPLQDHNIMKKSSGYSCTASHCCSQEVYTVLLLQVWWSKLPQNLKMRKRIGPLWAPEMSGLP
jgi:hypothetical protein